MRIVKTRPRIRFGSGKRPTSPRDAGRRRNPLPLALCVLILSSLGAGPSFAAFSFADYVVERNLARTGHSTEHFDDGRDVINRFNGALGYTVRIGPTYRVGGHLSYRLGLRYTSSVWSFTADGGGVAAQPEERFNAGLGWSLTFGELLAPSSAGNPSNFWVYVAPNGLRTRFYGTLADGETALPGFFYSRDSSYFRLEINGNSATMELPGGSQKSFQQTVEGWRFVSQSDVFGNQLSVDYGVAGQWVISDSHGRIHRVHFTADPTGLYNAIIDRVEVAAFGNTIATYDLAYGQGNVRRPPQDTAAATPASVSAPLLSSVTWPDGSVERFEYHLPQTSGAIDGGRLRRVELPTGGRIDYAYQAVELPFLAGAEHAADVAGVATRTTLVPGPTGLPGGGETQIGQWSFATSLDIPRVAGNADQPRELTTAVTYPDGHQERHYFSVYVSGNAGSAQGPAANFKAKDYGLPFTKNGTVGSYHRSRDVLDGASQLQTRYVRYLKSACAGCYDVQPRIDRRQIIHHHASGDWTVKFTYSNWDGVGHFGTSTASDSDSSAPIRTTTIDYSGNVPDTGSPWILGTSDKKTVSVDGETKIVEYCTDSGTGLRLRQRILAGGSRAAGDLLRVFEYSASGDLVVTRYYGGDTQALYTGSLHLCDMPIPAAEQFASFKEHQYGTARRSGWLDASGAVFLETRAATIDRNTGLVASQHSGDEFLRTYTYDALGRQTSATPPAGHGGRKTTVYTPATTTPGISLAEVHATVEDADGTVLSESKTQRDFFGRVTRVSQRTLNGWADTVTAYDAMGRVSSVTSPEGRVTRWLERDALGRTLRMRPPEGSAHDRVFAYGPRWSSETSPIGKQWDEQSNSVVEIDRTVTTTRDRDGRTVEKLTQDADGQWRRETFSVNMTGEVLGVTTTDGTDTSTWTQADRTDHRGFTVLDENGGPITGYDALGHLTLRDFGYGALVNLYDRAGRLREQRQDSATGALWTRNTYATTNSGSNYRKGKLSSAFRINRDVPHVPSGYLRVQDSYYYTGNQGSLSRISTKVIGIGVSTFRLETSRETNGLGQVTEIDYPDCAPAPSNAWVECTPLPARTLTYEYDLGWLTGVEATVGTATESWIDQVSYDPSGMPIGRVLANGFVEDVTPHPSGHGRAERMTVNHPQTGSFYDSGVAQYDARGKMVKLGDQRRVSEHAYSLKVHELPADNSDPVTLPTPPNRDIFGQQKRRFYRIPIRGGVQSSDGVEDVWEIYVYGPGNRLVWKRIFNDYDVWNFNRSDDEWYLIDPGSRRVRTRRGFSYYQGLRQVTYANGDLQLVKMTAAPADNADRIFAGSRQIGTSDQRFTAPRLEFFHYDIRGNLFAISDQDGDIRENGTAMY